MATCNCSSFPKTHVRPLTRSSGRQWRLNNTEDAQAVERNAAFYIGIFSEPVYGSGDWPELVKEALNETFLPRFTDEEKAEIKGGASLLYQLPKASELSLPGSADFFAIDLYRSTWIAAPPNGIDACVANSSDVNWPACNVEMLYNSETNWPVGIAADNPDSWLFATPQNVRYELKQMQKRWPTNKIVSPFKLRSSTDLIFGLQYISEFGFAAPEESIRTDLAYVLDDAPRVSESSFRYSDLTSDVKRLLQIII